ncbi:hypothetical protein Dimus_032165 [Dionaea muscipula]
MESTSTPAQPQIQTGQLPLLACAAMAEILEMEPLQVIPADGRSPTKGGKEVMSEDEDSVEVVAEIRCESIYRPRRSQRQRETPKAKHAPSERKLTASAGRKQRKPELEGKDLKKTRGKSEGKKKDEREKSSESRVKRKRGKADKKKGAEPIEKVGDEVVEIEKETQNKPKIQMNRKGVDPPPPVSRKGKEKKISESETEDDVDFDVDENEEDESEDGEKPEMVVEGRKEQKKKRKQSKKCLPTPWLISQFVKSYVLRGLIFDSVWMSDNGLERICENLYA